MILFNFAYSKISDIVQEPYDFKTFCSSSHKSNGHWTAVLLEMPCMHFSVQKDTGWRQAGHRVATGRGLATVQSGVVAIQFMLSVENGIVENFE